MCSDSKPITSKKLPLWSFDKWIKLISLRLCGDDYSCQPDMGPNPLVSEGSYISYDSFHYSFLTTFQVVTLDYWETVFNSVSMIESGSHQQYHIYFLDASVSLYPPTLKKFLVLCYIFFSKWRKSRSTRFNFQIFFKHGAWLSFRCHIIIIYNISDIR